MEVMNKENIIADAPSDVVKTVQQQVHLNQDEYKYLKQVEQILREGTRRDDRTGTGTISIFGMQSKYCLRNGTIPLLTTKRVYWKGVLEELLWFISGSTDGKLLMEKNVKIWEKNGDRAFLDNLGFTSREEGDLGPVYGFQWRHFGAKYVDCHTDYSGQGVDQLAEVIRQIKEQPDSRRIIMSAWNPSDLGQMVLPPCHTMCQFYVDNGELSCQLYQRSGDMGLGVPFNLASYGLLTHMIAKVCGLKPGTLVHTLGDAHVYSNHVDALKIQLDREPYAFPKIRFTRDVASIDDFTSDMIALDDYKCHPKIPMDMAV
uniref:Thymidylate synthase n=2 Tax=Caenorhabditis elegans TaxID=6239 RepID=Q9Y052_CAEEL|nr:Chain A, Thymidylate synthase [Caenorhabditis elegans]4IQB_B Chain B, Thymidylate synthase [Caenorhabditis elegans]4IQQ_A Chain A, Thymidylate synthase [Caenorhabditis elegans]4IQQ_B Chain B, Thymidylate synthase [Caenorhabditis elegans]4IQQ_C Chain C, Thymidylate synthase [Caenorhabditis elegans]4IQQ_D Chain D, Thymidylate synthase [Caenorhabditis elegans]4IRR_A Chain A, Thymidylate synthase [Caenorhabditis elegans]4IRR_B Chain B, Thymidylate synthase [Caenorhabditis elegans]4PSG_A Chai